MIIYYAKLTLENGRSFQSYILESQLAIFLHFHFVILQQLLQTWKSTNYFLIPYPPSPRAGRPLKIAVDVFTKDITP